MVQRTVLATYVAAQQPHTLRHDCRHAASLFAAYAKGARLALLSESAFATRVLRHSCGHMLEGGSGGDGTGGICSGRQARSASA